jgi:hypothetical protein
MIALVTAFCIVLGSIGALYFAVSLFGKGTLTQPRSKKNGDWVAEVWLEWEICRGSTMYRQRFRFRWTAYLAVRLRALMLDLRLPTRYLDTDWSGNYCVFRYEYAIHYGVRRLAGSERERFHAIWSTELPGTKGYRGEHASAHPLQGAGLCGSTDGFKL